MPMIDLLRGIQKCLQLGDGITQLLGTAEVVGNLDDVAVLGDGRYLEHIRDNELSRAMGGVLLQKLIQDGVCLGALLVEEVLAVTT